MVVSEVESGGEECGMSTRGADEEEEGEEVEARRWALARAILPLGCWIFVIAGAASNGEAVDGRLLMDFERVGGAEDDAASGKGRGT